MPYLPVRTLISIKYFWSHIHLFIHSFIHPSNEASVIRLAYFSTSVSSLDFIYFNNNSYCVSCRRKTKKSSCTYITALPHICCFYIFITIFGAKVFRVNCNFTSRSSVVCRLSSIFVITTLNWLKKKTTNDETRTQNNQMSQPKRINSIVNQTMKSKIVFAYNNVSKPMNPEQQMRKTKDKKKPRTHKFRSL